VAAGQAYTAECFFAESGSKLLASVIPPGKRAVAISVTDYAGLDGLIYPGSRVDVLASFKGEGSGDEHHDATTTTLLENVQVLAYEQHTVVSPDKKSLLGDMSDASRSGGMRRVTLLVDTKQSKTLELGAAVGILSLALRNPMDQSATNKDNVTFHSIFGDDQAATPPPPVFTSSAPTTLDKPAQWDMIVMKGGISETRSFILSSGPEGAKP